jgi:4-carboxymuconolactone decarboxylase
MKYLLAAAGVAALIAAPHISRAEDITRFAPLKPDELRRRKRPGPT